MEPHVANSLWNLIDFRSKTIYFVTQSVHMKKMNNIPLCVYEKWTKTQRYRCHQTANATKRNSQIRLRTKEKSVKLWSATALRAHQHNNEDVLNISRFFFSFRPFVSHSKLYTAERALNLCTFSITHAHTYTISTSHRVQRQLIVFAMAALKLCVLCAVFFYKLICTQLHNQ